MPTTPAQDGPAEPEALTPTSAAHTEAPHSGATVRVMAYLTEEEAQVLEELWFSMRRSSARASKSDILRAALLLTAQDTEALTATLSQQQSSTLSRQRSSKVSAKKAGD